MSMPVLTSLIALPTVIAGVILMTPERWARQIALMGSLLVFGLSLVLLMDFDVAATQLQMLERHSWISSLGVHYFVGVDGISIWLVLLTTFLTPIVVLGAWDSIAHKVRSFLVAILTLQSATLGTFLALDAVLFYVFFEVALVPMYFLIGIWGGPRRLYATTKFFLYTMLGSVFMLLAIVYLMLMTQAQLGQISASLIDFYRLEIPFVAGTLMSTQTLLFLAFCLAFAIKVPVFPLHTWLPDAHVEAPTAGSVVLAGVMLKMGTYGLLRFVIPLFPEASKHYAWVWILLGVIGIIYGALVAMVQTDIKKLVAYSSVSHMGYVVAGLFALNAAGMTGGLYQMLNHGVSTGALFLMVGMIYDRTHTRQIADYGGLAAVAPIYTICFLIVTLSSIAVPLTNGFVGEFLILLGIFQAHQGLGLFAVLGVVLGAAYMLWMVKRVFYGPMGQEVESHPGSSLEINRRELCVIMPLLVLIFWMGIRPMDFLSYSAASLNHLAKTFSNYQITAGLEP